MYRTSPSISALVTLLQVQQERFDSLLTLLAREREAITAMATASLVELSEAKLRLLDELRELDERRASAVARIAGNWGVPPETLTLHGIAERVGPIEAGILHRLKDRLARVVAAIRESTSVNSELIARSLAFLNQGLDVWRDAPKTSDLYSSHGALKSGTLQGALVRQKG
jgi:flagellar biosynthesis/type III secretory pathway chaperone